MINKTEYASRYVWHENAYSNKPEPLLQIRNYSLFSRHKGSLQQLSSMPQLEHHHYQQQRVFDSVLNNNVSLYPSPLSSPMEYSITSSSNRKEKAAVAFEEETKIKNSTKKSSRQTKRLSSTRRYSLDADARGIKSHFLPASIQVLLDLGINSPSKSVAQQAAGNVEGNGNNQYFTSVYKSDFSCDQTNK